MDGNYSSQRASLKNGDESTCHSIYRRSSFLKTLVVSPPSNFRVTWVRKQKVQKGTLSYSYNDEKSCINVCMGYVNFIDAMVLEKVNIESNGDEQFLATPSFYPALHRLLTLKRNWSIDFKFQDLSNFMVGSFLHSWPFWVSCFVLPYHNEVIRLEIFVMASLMAKGQKLSLAPTVLRCIYHGLGKVASHPNHPGRANICFPIHYVVGWLTEIFPALYSQRPNYKCPVDYPALMFYARMSAKQFTLEQARSIFRNEQSISFHASAFWENTMEISWLTSKVEETFSATEIITKIDGNDLELKHKKKEILK
ncbi:hypothetical protein Cgig2_009091 [Carnegiea gigantea]|uniref:Aminotransferase-like plant mobile domain-containing protein n=1 Tax=Carnegiea gigantea TaxID=171969 RepID=A0A9Q1KDJ3_9CARY|nr:hypothetical protein Cgig2_009091 [Carnegiea gigantea]